MMGIRTSFISCGVHQLFGLDEYKPKGVVEEVLRHLWRRTAFVIFSDIVDSYGSELAEYIKTNRLGHIAISQTAINPNSDNEIEVFVWKVNWDRVEKLFPKKKEVNSVR